MKLHNECQSQFDYIFQSRGVSIHVVSLQAARKLTQHGTSHSTDILSMAELLSYIQLQLQLDYNYIAIILQF